MTNPDPASKLPATSTPQPGTTVGLAGLIAAMGDLDPRLVRAEIALRLIRRAADNVRPTHPGAATLLDEAKAVLGPVTNGITGPGVGYAVEYVERVLDKLAETPARTRG